MCEINLRINVPNWKPIWTGQLSNFVILFYLLIVFALSKILKKLSAVSWITWFKIKLCKGSAQLSCQSKLVGQFSQFCVSLCQTRKFSPAAPLTEAHQIVKSTHPTQRMASRKAANLNILFERSQSHISMAGKCAADWEQGASPKTPRSHYSRLYQIYKRMYI